jgi:hypothetical protein
MTGSGVIAVAGEALVDFVPAGRPGLFEAAPGGSPANVAVGLARLEIDVRLLARIADDLLGHRIRAHLTGNGVDLSYAVRAAEPASLAIVAVGRDGVVEYDFRVQGTADWQWRDDELAGALDGGVVALHAGSLALTMTPGADALQRLLARARGTMTVSYDPNCRPLLMGSPEAVRGRIEALVALADLVKASADDLAGWWRWSTPSAPATPAWPPCSPACTAATCSAPTGAPRSRPSTPPPWPSSPTRRSWPPPSPAPAPAPTHPPPTSCAAHPPSRPAPPAGGRRRRPASAPAGRTVSGALVVPGSLRPVWDGSRYGTLLGTLPHRGGPGRMPVSTLSRSGCWRPSPSCSPPPW